MMKNDIDDQLMILAKFRKKNVYRRVNLKGNINQKRSKKRIRATKGRGKGLKKEQTWGGEPLGRILTKPKNQASGKKQGKGKGRPKEMGTDREMEKKITWVQGPEGLKKHYCKRRTAPCTTQQRLYVITQVAKGKRKRRKKDWAHPNAAISLRGRENSQKQTNKPSGERNPIGREKNKKKKVRIEGEFKLQKTAIDRENMVKNGIKQGGGVQKKELRGEG